MTGIANVARRAPRRIDAHLRRSGLSRGAGVAVVGALAASPARAEVCDKADGADAFVYSVMIVAALLLWTLFRHRAAPGQRRRAVIAFGWGVVCALFAAAIARDVARSDEVLLAARLEGCRAIWSDVLVITALAAAAAALIGLALRRLAAARRLRRMTT